MGGTKQVQDCTPVILALGRLRWGGLRFEASLGKEFTTPK
jgi:hypothetical protein